mmetsp:Transcript_11418/g.17172  ORF Transcript_11418/g.17172 Transcript_11418/m.17172 type:complete len:296 (+) Transcript_11418:179-1066(+)|eukprot:CAMPEP_0196822502 /NCGR_PEP_ID=MMETSP1362-20130617/83706_1 /TAXON_ID=163516 /ORGANISM="Leptocylindrus danicus, Strain CCMP1856" /LENGTH=295 /DNA_ID=CAMNT_0042202073 /DNA_START=93 /DNA_END=980 /DNA_ORIENTATION=-
MRSNPYTTRQRYRRAGGGGINLRPKDLSTKGTILLMLASISGLGLWFLTPLSDFIADAVLLFVPIESDVTLGREALLSLKRDSNLKPAYDAYGVEKAGWELVTSSGATQACPECIWDFGVVHADYMNAFALPGGVIRVTDKLAAALTVPELKALIGHEVGHVLNRHSQRRMIKQNMLKHIIGALLYEDNDGYEESFGEAVGEMLLKGAQFLGEQGFSRKDEYEADEAGWKLLGEAQVDPRAMVSMLRKLWRASGDSGETRWESTHPGTRDRIDALEKKWEDMSRSEKRRYERSWY